MAQSNFQDVVQLNQDTLSVLGNQIQLGSAAGSKSIVFAQDPFASSAINLVASNATGQETVIIPDANGTIGLVTAFSAGTTLFSNGELVFSNSNNITFGLNGGTITASAGTGTAILGIAAGTQTGTTGTIIFSNSNGISFGMSGSATITATADYVRSISAGTTNATGNQIVFSNSNNVSFGANGATITASASFSSPAGASVTAFSQWAEFNTNWSISNASMSMQKFSIPMNISATRAQLVMALSGHTNSSGALTVSIGVYTLAGSTASRVSTGSAQISWTSGSLTTASSQYGGLSGTRYITLPVTFNMTPGDYMMGFWFSTTNDGTWRVFGRNGVNIVGVYEGDTDFFIDGTSISSVASLLGSFNKTDTGYARTGLAALRQPGFILAGTI